MQEVQSMWYIGALSTEFVVFPVFPLKIDDFVQVTNLSLSSFSLPRCGYQKNNLIVDSWVYYKGSKNKQVHYFL